MKPDRRLLHKTLICCIASAVLFFWVAIGPSFADKTSVAITAPETAAPGTEITIQVTATHDANNFIHHTEWLKVMADGKEIARWDYSWNNKPVGKVFSKEIKYTVTNSVKITAEGHCNLHGSAGPQSVTVSVQNTSD